MSTVLCGFVEWTEKLLTSVLGLFTDNYLNVFVIITSKCQCLPSGVVGLLPQFWVCLLKTAVTEGW